MYQHTISSSADIPEPPSVLSCGGQSQKRIPNLDELFYIFGNKHRRIIFEMICHTERTIDELATLTYGRYQAVRKQLIVLEAYGLITSYRDGKYRYYLANNNPLLILRNWAATMGKISSRTS